MVEVTLTLVKDIVTIVGVIAGFTYYVMTVRNARKVRKEALVRDFLGWDIERHRVYMELLQMEWDDFDDYISKYDSTVNIDNYSKRAYIWNRYNRIGYELYQGNVDVEELYNYTGFQGIWFFWNKFKPIIMEDRKRYGNPHYFRWFEYLVDELVKERKRQGLSGEVIDFDGYISN